MCLSRAFYIPPPCIRVPVLKINLCPSPAQDISNAAQHMAAYKLSFQLVNRLKPELLRQAKELLRRQEHGMGEQARDVTQCC